MNAYEIEFSPELKLSGIDSEQVDRNPFLRFRKYFEQALNKKIDKANAACLATANELGQASVRVILIKKMSPAGLVFFTNYQSYKAKDLLANPFAELVFYWPAINTQIRIAGSVAKINIEESEQYFQSRPRVSQLGATVSLQSQIIDSRQELEYKIQQLDEKYKDQIIPLPQSWGGYCISPKRFEFWHNQAGRLHDRFQFQLSDGDWVEQRLAP